MKMKRKDYIVPNMELMSFEVESGFATSKETRLGDGGEALSPWVNY